MVAALRPARLVPGLCLPTCRRERHLPRPVRHTRPAHAAVGTIQ